MHGLLMRGLLFLQVNANNIGGDVVRISDTAGPARSKTRAAAVVLTDRGLGLMALVLVAAMGASLASAVHPAALPIWPVWLWAGFLVGAAASAPAVFAPAGFGRLLRPLTVIHPEWVGNRIEKLTDVLSRFKAQPGALALFRERASRHAFRYGGETELVRFPTAADPAIRVLPEHRRVCPVRNGDRNAAVPERSL